jgi:hypothetical protein
MPLNKAKLIADIVVAQEKAHKAKFNVDGRSIFAQEMANAIDLFIKSGDVQTITTGIGVVAPGIAVVAGFLNFVTYLSPNPDFRYAIVRCG